uniref:Uncharacterized protein n=1 Tax=Oryza glumipatula TaxID=40148 RepID=A0A0E0BGW9_9ORYZ
MSRLHQSKACASPIAAGHTPRRYSRAPPRRAMAGPLPVAGHSRKASPRAEDPVSGIGLSVAAYFTADSGIKSNFLKVLMVLNLDTRKIT